MTKTETRNNPIELSIKNLKLMSLQMGFDGSRIKGESEDCANVLQGSWSYQCPGQGLSMHCGKFEELEDLSVSIELPAGLSFNVILAGTVSFSLAGQRYQLGKDVSSAECSGFSLDHPEILTRQLSRGQQVYKVNIFVERDWLENRFSNAVKPDNLDRLFQHHARVHFWRPSSNTLRITRQILQSSPGTELTQNLFYESRVIELLSSCLNDYMRHGKDFRKGDETLSHSSKQSSRCKQFIDEHDLEKLSLQQIAELQHISVSTLQRRFKASYGMTVIDYIRQKKLDKARTALIRDKLSIGEAAYLAGYNHPSNFISAFKKRFSLTPTDYRKIHSHPMSGKQCE